MISVSRREFVIASGALVLPACGGIAESTPTAPTAPAAQEPAALSAGTAASAELDLESSVQAWTATAGARRLELSATGVSIQLPTRSPETISFDQLRMGVGHETIKRFFGQPTLAALLRALS
jgi:hypothetical protein